MSIVVKLLILGFSDIMFITKVILTPCVFVLLRDVDEDVELTLWKLLDL